ncbi:MAG: eL32 family ribosomal protein [Candidatus Diapherotrites archaeon]
MATAEKHKTDKKEVTKAKKTSVTTKKADTKTKTAEKKETTAKKKTAEKKPGAKKTIKKSSAAKKAQALIKKKVKKPSFRGRFGSRKFRRKSNAKWDKWRKPRGIDIKDTQENGTSPRTGYGTCKLIKTMHPSGYYEKMIFNPRDLDGIDAERFALRISAGVGKKKRSEIAKKAREMGLRILNR